MIALANELRVATEDVDEDRDGGFGWRMKGAGDGGRVGVEEILDDGVEVGLVGVTEGVGDAVGRGPVYFSPNSPGEKTTTEQKPSVDVISNVLPSGDLKHDGLTIQSTGTDEYRYKPCKICKRCIMQIAYHAKRRLLLGVIYQNSILRCDCIYNSIRQ